MGGLAWFGIPLGIATSLGLAAVALSHGETPQIVLSAAEVSAGLPAVKAAAALAGQSGAVAMLILLFLAVTSACSAEQIATSSILTYDVYGTYINRNASEKQILWTSRSCIFGYSLFMGAIATAFNYIGVSMGYLYELMGTIIGSAVVPIALCITWKKCNGTGAVVGAILGFVAAIAGWIGITSKLNHGVVTVDTTFGDYEMLTGNLLAIGVGGLITVGWSLVRPANFDWEITRAINTQADSTVIQNDHVPLESPGQTGTPKDTKESDVPATVQLPSVEHAQSSEDVVALERSFRFASFSALTLVFVLIFAIPLPLFFSSHIYSASGFTAWVVVSVLWLFGGLGLVGLYPLWEARKGLTAVGRGIYGDIRGRR